MSLSFQTHPACRHAARTISSPTLLAGVWRVVSEDSDYLGACLAVIHCLCDFDDLNQPTFGEVYLRLHQIQTLRELQEVAFLRSSQRILLEEWDDCLKQITPLSNAISVHVFFVVVVSPVYVHSANTKEFHEHVKTLNASRALGHRKLMCHLETSLVTLSIDSIRLTDQVD